MTVNRGRSHCGRPLSCVGLAFARMEEWNIAI